MKTVKVRLYGKVQGVNFRVMVQKKALDLNVKGFVKNDPYSILIVHAVFQGEKKNIEKMLNFLRSNPGRSQVEDIKVEDRKGESERFLSFERKM